MSRAGGSGVLQPEPRADDILVVLDHLDIQRAHVCQGKGFSQFRAAPDSRDPHQRFTANELASPESRLVCHQRNVDLVALYRSMKVDTAGTAQFDFDYIGIRQQAERLRWE